MSKSKTMVQVEPGSRTEWRTWLKKNHKHHDSIWLVIKKKESKLPGVAYVDAVEEALCFGWIDSVTGKIDKDRFRIRMSRRHPTSNWSPVNKVRVKRLIAENLMTPAGMAVIAIAKKNGAWKALDEIEKLVIPADLKQALSKNKKANENFGSFPKYAKKYILAWIASAKLEETRKKRIAEVVSQAVLNIRANLTAPAKVIASDKKHRS